MYTAFNLKISLSDFSSVDEYIHIGKKQKLELSKFAKKELDDFILSDEILDGEKLSESWFKTVESDVFISHSHNDVELAYALAYPSETEVPANRLRMPSTELYRSAPSTTRLFGRDLINDQNFQNIAAQHCAEKETRYKSKIIFQAVYR